MGFLSCLWKSGRKERLTFLHPITQSHSLTHLLIQHESSALCRADRYLSFPVSVVYHHQISHPPSCILQTTSCLSTDIPYFWFFSSIFITSSIHHFVWCNFYWFTKFWHLHSFSCLGAFHKLQNRTISFALSVRMKRNSAPTRWIFVKFHT